MNTIITLTEVKSLSQITTTSNDAYIEDVLIPVIEDYVKDYCNDNFLDGYPLGIKLVIAKMIRWELAKVTPGTTSESIGKYSINLSGDYPAEIITLLNNYVKVKFI